MPHIIVEYSANLEADVDIQGLILALHQKAVATEALPTGGIRVRAARRDMVCVGDGDSSNGFISTVLRIATGRSLELRKQLGQELFSVVTDFVQDVYDKRPLALSFEVQEIDTEMRWNKGNIRDYMALREKPEEQQ